MSKVSGYSGITQPEHAGNVPGVNSKYFSTLPSLIAPRDLEGASL